MFVGMLLTSMSVTHSAFADHGPGPVAAGTESVAVYYVDNRVWLTWNAATRNVVLEARQWGFTNTCIDAVFDWGVTPNPGAATHFDARVLRDCSTNKPVRLWNHIEQAATDFTFTRAQKVAGCLLFSPQWIVTTGPFGTSSITGHTGSNIDASNNTRTSGCANAPHFSGGNSTQAKAFVGGCAEFHVYTNSQFKIFGGGNRRSCS